MVASVKLFYTFLVFLLLLIQQINFTFGLDGCEKDHYWRCGDICLDSDRGVCTCGEKNFGYDDGLWCCKSSQGYCTTDKTYGADRNIGTYSVTCHESHAIPLTQQCHGVCNHDPSDKGRNGAKDWNAKRSYLDLCLDGSTCVEETALCSGTSFCPNKEDLRWCENAKSVKLLEHLTSDDDIYCNALGKSNEKSSVGQKIKKFNRDDGRTYNCLNRQDEDPFKVKTEKKDWQGNLPCKKGERRCLGQRSEECIQSKYWGDANDDGCPDKSDVVKDMNTDTTKDQDPCGGETYISPRGASFDVTWDWFPCHRTQKCIHFRNRCDLHPHPECIFENDQGETVGEDEEGCQKEDYQNNALMEQSAIFPCQSETHNKLSSAVRSTVYDWTSKLSDRKFRIINSDESYLNDVIVMMKGTIVNLLSTRSQCLK